MPKTVYVDGNPVALDPKRIIGSGGEAEIFNIGGGYALKIFKSPDHPDYVNLPPDKRAIEQKGAKDRIVTHQRKLREFPKNLPTKVVTPIDLATDASGAIVGYKMNLVPNAELLMRYSERLFRAAVSNQTVDIIFRGLYSTVDATHNAGVVLGDFNDLNVLVANTDAYIIDTDSCQWGPYLCKTYTDKFVDPILCDPAGLMSKPHNTDSDWYAFSVMLFQSLLFTDPYGGTIRSKNPKDKILPSARRSKRITVLNPEVTYPKPATPYWVLPDDLLEHFHRLFEKDARGIFPIGILENMRWTQCSTCGLIHARGKCPHCNQAAPGTIKEREAVRVDGKKIIFTRLFQTSGRILYASYQNGIKYLYQDSGEKCFRREDGSIVADNVTDDPRMRFRINGKNTIIAMGHKMLVLSPTKAPEVVVVDTFGSLPMFDANETHRYWLTNGQLWRDEVLGNELIGESLENQTLFWVGPKFGFGFYQSGELSRYFVFGSNRSGINDSVKLPRINGQLVDSICIFSDNLCWFFVSTQYSGKRINHCYVIKSDGTVIGSAENPNNDIPWLNHIRGKLAMGNFLLSTTDDGIVKVQPNTLGQIEKTQEFPDTEPYISSADHLFPGSDGLTIIKPKEVWNLRIV